MGLFSSNEELATGQADVDRAKKFANDSRKDADNYYLGESSHWNPELEQWEPPVKSSNEETPPSKTNPNAKTGDAQDVSATPATQTVSFNISKFRSEIDRNGVLPTNRFLVIFARPKTLSSIYSTEFLTMRCENATVPGVNFFTSQTVRYGYGQTERRPYLPTFNPITLSFIVDKSSTVVGLFNAWTNSIVNYDVSKGMYTTNGRASPYVMTYKDNYICPQMQIYVYDYENKKQIKVTLYDAYPLSTSDVQLGWGQNDEVMKYSVSLQYTHITVETVTGNAVELDTVSTSRNIQFQGETIALDREIDAQLIARMTNPTNLDTTGSNLSPVDAARFTLFNGVPNPKF